MLKIQIQTMPPCSPCRRMACSWCDGPACLDPSSLTTYGNDRTVSEPSDGSFHSNLWTVKTNHSCRQIGHLFPTYCGQHVSGGQPQETVGKPKVHWTKKSDGPPNSWVSGCYSWANHSSHLLSAHYMIGLKSCALYTLLHLMITSHLYFVG